MMSGFKKFILRGNVVDLAVGIVIGTSFSDVVNSLVKGIFTPFISAFGGLPDFSHWTLTVNKSIFRIGDFINALITFLFMALILYFFVVLPINKLVSISNKKKVPEDPSEKKCPYCSSTIPFEAIRCPMCTSKLSIMPK